MASFSSFETKQIDELFILDDWSSAWAECLKLQEKWVIMSVISILTLSCVVSKLTLLSWIKGGRGRGGRATGRCTVQTKDVVVEGITLSIIRTSKLHCVCQFSDDISYCCRLFRKSLVRSNYVKNIERQAVWAYWQKWSWEKVIVLSLLSWLSNI